MKLLTPKEAALQAKVSRSLVYAWCEERRLSHIRAGAAGKRGRILIREDDLLALLKECRVERIPHSPCSPALEPATTKGLRR